MSFTSIGDLAQTHFLQRRNTTLKQTMQKLGQELASGQTSDIAAHMGGSYARLTSVERDMRISQGYLTSLGEYRQMTGAMQTALEQVRLNAQEFSSSLLASPSGNTAGARQALIDQATHMLANTVSTFNQTSAGRGLFNGDASQGAALAASDTILTAVSAHISGAAGAAAVEAAVADWFANPAGFETSGYLGSTTSIAPLRLSETAAIDLDIRADDPAVRDVLNGLVLAAIVEDPGVTLSDLDKETLQHRAGELLLAAQDTMVGLQANLGFVEEQVDTWSTRMAASVTSLEYTRNALLEVDPFKAATELEAAQFQLEGLYSITVRLSQMSLVNFIR